MVDERDKKIIEYVEKHGNVSTRELSKATNIPVTTVHKRKKQLEEQSIIRGYHADIDYSQLGKDIVAHILLTVSYRLPSGTVVQQKDVAEQIQELDAVESVDIITGTYDIIVRTRTSSMNELNTVVTENLRNIPGVEHTESFVVLN